MIDPAAWRRACRALAIAVVATGFAGNPATAGREPVRIFAAASLIDVVEALGDAYRHPDRELRIVPAASSTLARQIAAGASAHLFLSADRQWMDWLAEQGRIVPGSRLTFASNTLVIAMRETVSAEPESDPASGASAVGDILRRAAAGRIAIGDPDHVPAGRYARAVLSATGVWDAIEPHLVPTADTRAALRLVSEGAVAAGLVYRTDALAGGVRIVAHLADPDPPIVYQAALIAGPGRVPDSGAAAFLAFLASPDAAVVLCAAGFRPLAAAARPCEGAP